jgi:hypothetical protein
MVASNHPTLLVIHGLRWRESHCPQWVIRYPTGTFPKGIVTFAEACPALIVHIHWHIKPFSTQRWTSTHSSVAPVREKTPWHPPLGPIDFQALKLRPVSTTFSSQFSDIVGIPEVPLHAGRSYVLWDSSRQQLWRNTYGNYPLASTCDLISLIRFDWPVSDCWDVSDKPVEVKYGTGNRNQSRSWRWNSPKNLSHQKYLPC